MKTFGHQRPQHDKKTGELLGLIDSPARAVTREILGAAFLADKDRRLVVSLEAGDLICFRPSGTRRVYKRVAKDVFAWVLRCEANALVLAAAREKKERKSTRLAQQRQERAERRLFK